MRILQIVPSISLIYGGPSQMVMGLSSALARENVKVTILTTDSNGDSGQKPLDVPLNCPVKQDGYEIIYFRCSPFRRYKFSLLLLKWLNNHADEFDLAHIHALFSPISSVAATVCRQKNLPYILRPLGTLDPADLRKKKQLKQLYATILERANLGGAAAIHFTSDQEAKISERFGVSTHDLVIPLGVILPGGEGRRGRGGEGGNAIRTQFGIPLNVPLVLFMSRIDPKKGLNLLIPALEKLLAEGGNFYFVLAGTNPQDPDYEEKIRLQIENSPLRSHTTITGFVTGELKSALLQAADLFVLPSYYENFGIAVAEAMVAGVPVIISDQVHIWHQVRDSESGWVGTTDVESLVELLRFALQNPAECRRRGLRAQEYALSNFSWEAIARQMIQAYNQILTSKTRI
ncbi:hormogonium polysaccharide biosynthesis glycosyltransferase HpsP [Plectonema radiosum NIES-515]|uniref:Hormogonium polysaccharide biosynthesis glycosyltransferase HpsP n=1 Tax=Plectonema radiosum NIES-515 TaxID=2986073 RepID=A0ABT3B2S9_9CYAN|nr:hormogonium polysaccharide biosynthesis glycosyltransferase HpsP [Plectonema radiosum]MCV3215677.1 hormogonium polysaccharide biosynthesis glycosyltransferase HpsP [Plectonema radiosum NIES-515]